MRWLIAALVGVLLGCGGFPDKDGPERFAASDAGSSVDASAVADVASSVTDSSPEDTGPEIASPDSGPEEDVGSEPEVAGEEIAALDADPEDPDTPDVGPPPPPSCTAAGSVEQAFVEPIGWLATGPGAWVDHDEDVAWLDGGEDAAALVLDAGGWEGDFRLTLLVQVYVVGAGARLFVTARPTGDVFSPLGPAAVIHTDAAGELAVALAAGAAPWPVAGAPYHGAPVQVNLELTRVDGIVTLQGTAGDAAISDEAVTAGLAVQRLALGVTGGEGVARVSALTFSPCPAGGAPQALCPADCPEAETPCLLAVCNPLVGCAAVPASAAASCECGDAADCAEQDDGDACNGTLICADGQCVVDSATVPDCGVTGDGCLIATCQPATGACVAVAVSDGVECDDGTVCTAGDSCTAGACGGVQVGCEDGDPCTSLDCDPELGCTLEALKVQCDDGDPCTVADHCGAAGCAGTTLSCDDGNPCTTDSCGASGCAHEPVAADCEDGDLCTVGDACSGGACQPGAPAVCDDGVACTADGCVPAIGCWSLASQGPCDDGDPCTPSDSCSDGACVGSGALVCDDADPCTADACEPLVGCVSPPAADGVACDDDDPCTAGDWCAAGACVPGPSTACECVVDADCAPLEDGDLCNGTLRCEANACALDPATVVTCSASAPEECQVVVCAPATGECTPVAAADTSACDDGDACTGPDVCTDGACGGAAVVCDDGESCTTDSCSPTAGCQSAPAVGACDDGDLCTLVDSCQGGTCVGSGAPSCADGNPCTQDSCLAAVGCVSAPAFDGAPCDDGLSCTVQDVCAGGGCSGGGSPDCSDGVACTVDTCTEEAGCVSLVDHSACDDGLHCTGVESCDATGGCVPGIAVLCDDSNPCTADGCDEAAMGCAFDTLGLDGTACDNGDSCAYDACVAGSCAAASCASFTVGPTSLYSAKDDKTITNPGDGKMKALLFTELKKDVALEHDKWPNHFEAHWSAGGPGVLQEVVANVWLWREEDAGGTALVEVWYAGVVIASQSKSLYTIADDDGDNATKLVLALPDLDGEPASALADVSIRVTLVDAWGGKLWWTHASVEGIEVE